jgi:hypothetical protein
MRLCGVAPRMGIGECRPRHRWHHGFGSLTCPRGNVCIPEHVRVTIQKHGLACSVSIAGQHGADRWPPRGCTLTWVRRPSCSTAREDLTLQRGTRCKGRCLVASADGPGDKDVHPANNTKDVRRQTASVQRTQRLVTTNNLRDNADHDSACRRACSHHASNVIAPSPRPKDPMRRDTLGPST